MNSNESPVQSNSGSPDVESLLKQMALRSPSPNLDVAISGILSATESKPNETERVVCRPVSTPSRFGWSTILATAAAAMVVGIWLGSCVKPADLFSKATASVAHAGLSDSTQLTQTSFNVEAFNLLHGHSQKAEFKDCEQCHQKTQPADDGLEGILQHWFYGDASFFESHADGLKDCLACHVAGPEPHEDAAASSHQAFADLTNCLDCHKVDANGFHGFAADWRAEG